MRRSVAIPLNVVVFRLANRLAPAGPTRKKHTCTVPRDCQNTRRIRPTYFENTTTDDREPRGNEQGPFLGKKIKATSTRQEPSHFTKGAILHTFFFSLLFLPIIVSVVDCPTGPHPLLQLARRPNRGHIGGGGWTPSCGTCL